LFRILVLATILLQLACLPAIAASRETDAIALRVSNAALPTYEWSNDSLKTRGVIVALHGATRHGTAFDTMARRLASQGFHVVALDLRGHGAWYHGRFANRGGLRIDYMKAADDLAVLLQALRKTYPALPLFCLGESIGSAVIIHTASANAELMDGMILLSPGTRPRVYNPFWFVRDFLRGITKLDQPLDVSPYIARYASDDRRIVTEMLQDPLSRNQLSGRDILRTSWFLSKVPRVSRQIRKDMPILVIQGKRDHIVSIDSGKQVWRHLPSSDKTLLEMPSCGHVLLQTAFIKPAAMQAVSDWLSERTGQRIPVAVQAKATIAGDLRPGSVATTH
jgi:alpha-beta hydrolase superfamily lysophospholipase